MSNKSDFESSPFIQDGELPQGIANALLRHNADAILIGDVETRTLVWANRAGEEMLGRDQAEIQGLPLAAIHPPEDLAYVMGQFDSQSRREFLITNDIPVLDAKGKISYHDVQSVPVQIDGHNYLMGCFRNIADRKEAEARALEGERRFEQVIKELPMGLHLYHLMEDGRLVFIGANRAADQILGLNHDDFINKELEEAFPDLKGTKIPDIYRKLAGDGGVWREEQLVYEDDKISGAFEVVAFQVRPGEMGALFWDITERSKSEAEMRRLQAAINAMAESVLITDSKGIIQYANPYFEELTGYALKELRGQHVRVLKSGAHDDKFYQELWDVLGKGESWNGSFINRKKDGSAYHESATISPVKNEKGEVISYVAVKRDMTKELDLERQVMRSQKMAALGQFANKVVHDVTNSLTVIHGSAEILQNDATSDQDKKLLNNIMKSIEDVSCLASDIMAFAHPASMNVSKLRLDNLIKGMRDIIEHACKPAVSVKYDLPEKLKVEVDAGQMEQAIMHLVVNATEAIKGTGTLDISVKSGMMNLQVTEETGPITREVPAAIIKLTDSGEGLTKEVSSRAFEPFYSTKSDAGRNVGLGLATVYSIISAHKGDVAIFRKDGNGATVKISLPLAE